MKTKLLFLIGFFALQTLFAQTVPGIAVQGIARDADKAALVDELLTFTFDIQDSDGKSYYKEEVDIKTDPYGVFSHIIGTGVPGGVGNFNEIPFGQTHMKLVISVNYNGNNTKISDGPFQYAPYAKSADNGVPTGTIVAFAGQEANIPKGWVLCDGRSLTTIENSKNLIALIGNNVPNLQGMFLRGTGTSAVNNQAGPTLGNTQDDAFESHTITGTAAGAGAHSHELKIDNGGGEESKGWRDNMVNSPDGPTNGWVNYSSYTEGVGNHTHTVSGSADGGANETRPVNYGVNYIIKL